MPTYEVRLISNTAVLLYKKARNNGDGNDPHNEYNQDLTEYAYVRFRTLHTLKYEIGVAIYMQRYIDQHQTARLYTTEAKHVPEGDGGNMKNTSNQNAHHKSNAMLNKVINIRVGGMNRQDTPRGRALK